MTDGTESASTESSDDQLVTQSDALVKLLINQLAPGDLHDDYDGNEFAAVNAAVERIEALESDVEEYRQENATLKAKFEEARRTQPGSKQELAKRISVNKLEVAAKKKETTAFKGAHVTVGKVREAAEGLGKDLHRETVYRSWKALEREWPDIFEQKAPTDEKPKRLVTGGRLPPEVVDRFHGFNDE